MSGVTSFTVFHKNKEAREELGRGFVVGKLEQTTSYQYSGTLPDGKTPAVITENKVVLKYEVLWDNQRHVSPSLHLSTDLEWEMLTEEFIILTSPDDDEEEEESEGEGETILTDHTTGLELEQSDDTPVDQYKVIAETSLPVDSFMGSENQDSPTV